MKRAILSLLRVALLASTLPALALAQPAPLPDDARFDQPVEFKTDAEGESLRAMIAALARAVGLTPVVEDVSDAPIVYDIGDPKPFRQVWDLVLTLEELEYRLLDNDMVVVGSPEVLARLERGREAPEEATTAESRIQRFYRVNNAPEDVAAVVREAVPGVDVSVLGSVGSIGVTGTQAQHDRVQATLDQFDSVAERTPIELRSYVLSNADAETLAPLLQASVAAASPAGEDAGEGEGAGAAGLSVSADARTNSLLVAAPASVQARVAELLPGLDVPQPQVNVQVRIQEITRSTAFDFGLDLNGSVGRFATSILDGGLSLLFDPAKAITSMNIGATLDTLERQGLARRVDDTNLTMLNNDTGSLVSGGTIFISIPGSDGNIERTIPYGVQVDVTPRIAADGRVTLEISARVEDVLSDTGDPGFLQLSTRAVTSTVTLEPGQTVLLGGLLQNVLTQTENRVPVLGSLPLIGGLFGSTVIEEDSTELLLVVTADVLE